MDWLTEATEAASSRHDSTCRNRSGCSNRDWHIQNDFMHHALHDLVIDRRQVIQTAERDIREMRMWRATREAAA